MLNNAVLIDKDKLEAYTAKGCPLCNRLIIEAKKISVSMNPKTIREGFKYYYMNEDITPSMMAHLKMAGHRNFPHLQITHSTYGGIPLKKVIIIECQEENKGKEKTNL